MTDEQNPIVGEGRALEEANTFGLDLCNTQVLTLQPTAHFQAICNHQITIN